MRVLVTGAAGLLGQAVCHAAAADGHDVRAGFHSAPGRGPYRWAPLDVTNAAELSRALRDVDAVVHTAYVQSGPDAEAVNVGGAANLAGAAADAGTTLVHVSSDVVFAGEPPRPSGYREDDPVRPVPGFGYGLQKAEAERRVHGAHPAATIVRTSLLYDLAGGSSLERMVLAAADPGGEISHFVDEYRCPAHVADVAGGIVALLGPGSSAPPAVLHLGGPQRLSRAETALALAPHLGVDPGRLSLGPTPRSGSPRPADLTLDSSLAARLIGYAPRPLGSPGAGSAGGG